jgi:hypothetical protein
MALGPLTITNFITADGLPVADGEVSIRLNKDCMGPSGQVSTRAVLFALDSAGAPIGSPLFWPNNQLVPSDSVYIISVRNSEGQRILGPEGIFVGGSGTATGFGASFGASFGS